MDRQHRLQQVGQQTTLAANPGVVRFDQLYQRLPWHNRFHLSEETLAPVRFLAVNCS